MSEMLINGIAAVVLGYTTNEGNSAIPGIRYIKIIRIIKVVE